MEGHSMSVTVDQHVVQQFTDGISHLAQQKMSRLRGLVDVDPKVVGDRAYYNQLGQTTMSKRTSRHGDTEYTDTPHLRRMVTLESWDIADLLDTDDKVQMLTDPLNSYSQSFAMAAGRTIDDIIIEAAFATAKTGQTGTGTETWPTTESPKIAFNYVADSDMTVDKAIKAKEQMDSNEVPENDRYMIVTAAQISNMLTDQEVTSSDYNVVKALVQGDIDTYLGFKWVRSERLLVTTATPYTRALAFQKNSIKLAIGINPRGRISEMPGKRYSMQAFYEMRVGATRMDPYGVVEIECNEAA
jgi:hypothetical protein